MLRSLLWLVLHRVDGFIHLCNQHFVIMMGTIITSLLDHNNIIITITYYVVLQDTLDLARSLLTFFAHPDSVARARRIHFLSRPSGGKCQDTCHCFLQSARTLDIGGPDIMNSYNGNGSRAQNTYENGSAYNGDDSHNCYQTGHWKGVVLTNSNVSYQYNISSSLYPIEY
jgi:hypothetical protein